MNVLRITTAEFIERFKPITLNNGSIRVWRRQRHSLTFDEAIRKGLIWTWVDTFHDDPEPLFLQSGYLEHLGSRFVITERCVFAGECFLVTERGT